MRACVRRCATAAVAEAAAAPPPAPRRDSSEVLVRKALRRAGVVPGLAARAQRLWPVSLRPERQRIASAVLRTQRSPDTFDADLYDANYRAYLAEDGAYTQVMRLVKSGRLHWSDLLLAADAPAPAALRADLAQVGVVVGQGRETTVLWLLRLALEARRRGSEACAELAGVVGALRAGRDSDHWSLAVAVLANAAGGAGAAVDMLANMERDGSVFTARGFVACVAPGGIRYDIVHGPPLSGNRTLDAYDDAVAGGGRKPAGAGVLAVLVCALRRQRSADFWRAVQAYQKASADIGPLPPAAIELVFLEWCTGRGRDGEAVEAAAAVMELHGLPGHAASIREMGPSAPAPRRRKAKRVRRPKVGRAEYEAACVRELLRNAPYGGDRMLRKYISVTA